MLQWKLVLIDFVLSFRVYVQDFLYSAFKHLILLSNIR